MRDRGFRRRMQFNIKRRMYEHVLTVSSVCIDTSFLFSSLALRLYKTVVLFYQWQHKPNCNNVVKNSKKKRKKEKRKIGLEWNRNVHLTPFYISGSARVFGYTVYRGFLNRVYGILQLKYGIRYITFFEFQVWSIPENIPGYMWMNFGYFGVFWRIFLGYTGIPLPLLTDPDISWVEKR